jgi:Spy/CpxP family protein refolding chaperone
MTSEALRKILVGVAAVAALSIVGCSQAPSAGGSAPSAQAGAGGGGAGRMQAMIAGLNLTPDQKAKVDPILAEMKQKAAAAAGDPDARRAAMRDGMTKIDALLTPEQKAKLAAARAAARGGGGAMAPSGMGG